MAYGLPEVVVVLVVVSVTLFPGAVFLQLELEQEAVVTLDFADSAIVAVVPPVSVESC